MANKRRKISKAEALLVKKTWNRRVQESKKGKQIRFLGEDEMPGEGPEAYFVAVDVPGADPEIKVKGDGVFIGPFDSPEQAADASADDAEVINCEGEPAFAEEGEEDDGGFDMDELTMESVSVKDIRTVLRGKIKEAADEFDSKRSTTAVNNDGTTDSGSGTHEPSTVGGGVNQSAADAGKQNPNPDSSEFAQDPNLDGTQQGTPKTGPDGTLQSNGGTDGVSESAPFGVMRGSFITVMNRKTEKKVDSGVVAKVEDNTVYMKGSNLAYPFKDFYYKLLA